MNNTPIFNSDYIKELPKDKPKLKFPIMPIIKLLTILIFCIVLNFIYNYNYSNYKYSKYLNGLWGDSNGNYYIIKDNLFQMNTGDINQTFFIGEIESEIKTDTGYKLLINGDKYSLDNNTMTLNKQMSLILNIENYTEDLKSKMSADFGNGESFKIIRLKDSVKETDIYTKSVEN